MGYNITFYLLFTCTVCLYVVATLKCPPGTFLHTIIHSNEEFCIECQDGTFMSLSDHRETSCRPCEKIKDLKMDILGSPCNKTHDAVIHCVDGYYRDEARPPLQTGMCKKCTQCPDYTGRPCGTYRDAICCPDENYDVAPDHDGVIKCKERPWFCRRGQYFDTRGFYCLPCPVNTFMPLDYHIQTQCLECKKETKDYRPLHSVIVQPCNSTHGPVIRCEDSFFIKPNMGNSNDSTGCSPCTDCSTKTDVQYEGRKCDGMEDTVCCPQPNMTVVDTSKGPVCCPEANMTVVDTPDGPACKTHLKQNSDGECNEGQCPHQTRERGITDCHCALCPETSICPGNADQNTTVDPDAQETFSNNNQKSSKDFSLAYLFGGIVIGVVLSFVFPLIYKKFCRDCWPRQKASHKSPQPEDPIESVPLNASRDTLSEEIDDHSKEQCCGNESELNSKSEKCRNVDDHHTRFIDANVFALKHLPQVLREDGKMAYIGAVRDLTVRLKVNHTSKNRPKNFPCHKLRGDAGAGIKRFGTGLVFKVIKRFEEDDNGACPCTACKVDKREAKRKWAEFAVVTSAHVVYDDTECTKTSCRLWFDHDEDYIKAQSLNGRRVEETDDTTPGVRIMHCVTHDEEVSHKLEEEIAQLDNLRQQYNRTSTTEDEEENRQAVLISHQHALSKKLSVGEAKVKMDGGIQKWSYDLLTCPGSFGAPICILGKSQGAGILTTIHGMRNESTGFYL